MFIRSKSRLTRHLQVFRRGYDVTIIGHCIVSVSTAWILYRLALP